ncbi:MAG TPA: enoyl-CoA hydratase [Desulfotomaculum sp.]|nr:enoyl-CoA hydratase [Desulfotomaculum sp.]
MERLKIGDQASITKTISEEDVNLFAGITQDFNPLHMQDEYARESIFKRRVAHGMLTASLISAVIGTVLPGPGTIYLEQTLKFHAPAFIGDTITALVEVIDKAPGKKRIQLKTTCKNQNDQLILSGQALVMPGR